MDRIALFIKTYKGDFIRTQHLLQSIEQFNADDLPVFLSVNDDDFNYFKRNLGGKYLLCKDSELIKCNPHDGWRRQAIVKPHFYRLQVAENYLVVDADALFIRPFYANDFMYDAQTPYTIMHENKDFLDMVEVLGMDSHNIFHIKALQSIRDRFGTHGKWWDYGPNPHLWSCKVWQHFIEVYLAAENHSFESFYNEMELTALPHEAAIYGEYLLKTRLIDILPVEGFFKVFHYKEQFELERSQFDMERLKKNYMGIIMQSNWHHEDDMPPEEKKWWQKILGR